MKRFISIIIAGAMLASLCGCGCEKKEEEGSNIVNRPGVVATVVPAGATDPDATEKPAITISPQGTVEPLEDSEEVNFVSADEVPTAESTDEFAQTEVEDGYIRYMGGDTKWGIILPPEAQIGDEAEDSSLFVVGPNIVTAVIVDRVTEITSVAQAKEHYADFGEIAIDDFTVIRDNGEYAGCYFEYLTQDGARGFAKYVVNGKKTVSAAGVNMTHDAAQSEILREIVNSVVIFD